MKIMAIDGAARRNGKPDCVSAGGVFIFDDSRNTTCLDNYEAYSTNQRGEMLALILALKVAADDDQIITDSEYLFNAMTKQWYDKWAHGSWLTSSGDAVKNRDLWEIIAELARPINYYHIKGHCISVGKVTSAKLLKEDETGFTLYNAALKRFDASTKDLAYVQELSLKNNGFELPSDILRKFIAANTVADTVATQAVEKALTAEQWKEHVIFGS